MSVRTIVIYATNDESGKSPQAGWAKIEVNRDAEYAEITTDNNMIFRVPLKSLHSLRECLNAIGEVLW